MATYEEIRKFTDSRGLVCLHYEHSISVVTNLYEVKYIPKSLKRVLELIDFRRIKDSDDFEIWSYFSSIDEKNKMNYDLVCGKPVDFKFLDGVILNFNAAIKKLKYKEKKKQIEKDF